MRKTDILKAIVQKAKEDKRKRKDHRYMETMGFLLAKGFLKTNMQIPLRPNKHVFLADAIWAGKHVEPRILEVLPAAIARFPKHFDLDKIKYPELFLVVRKLAKQEKEGPALWGIPYEKLKVWTLLPMRDKRVKETAERRITRTFRLHPLTITALSKRAKELNCTETAVLEMALGKRIG